METHEHSDGTRHAHRGGEREHRHSGSADRDRWMRRRRGVPGLRYGISAFGYMPLNWTAQQPPLNGDQFNGEGTEGAGAGVGDGTGGDGGGSSP